MLNRFYFTGFQPEGTLKGFAEQRIDSLLQVGPSDANWLGSVQSVAPGTYLARFDLYSVHGPFLADSLASSPQEAISQVIEKIASQLRKWKDKRFLQEQAAGFRDPYISSSVEAPPR